MSGIQRGAPEPWEVGAQSAGTSTFTSQTIIGNAQLPERLGPYGKYLFNCNAPTDNGWWATDITSANSPDASSYFVGMTLRYGIDLTADYREQVAFEITGSQRMFRRTQTAGTWSSWVQVGATPYAAGFRSTGTDQSITSATLTTVGLTGTPDHDLGGITIASSIVTIVSAGTYDLRGNILWNSSASNTQRQFKIETWTGADPGVGLGTSLCFDDRPTGNAGYVGQSIGCTHTFVAGAKVRMTVYQTTGGALTILNSTMPSKLDIRKIS